MEFKGQITSASHAMKYILAGKAFVTFRSLASGTRFTYKIELADKRQPNDPDVYFVNVLTGPDNWTNYKYIGVIKNNEYRWTAKSKIGETAPSVVGFKYCFAQLAKNAIKGFEVWHEGKCGRCGAKLTVPESVATGFGPECVKLVGYQRSAPTPVGAATTADGGSFLDQPTLNFAGGTPITLIRGGVRMFGKLGTGTGRSKFDGRQAAAALYAPAKKVPQVSAEMDARIREKIDEYKAEAPENYYQDGEVDDHAAFRAAYEMFRRELEGS